jgi:hypothetical protein
MTPLPTPHLAGVTLRAAHPDDAAALARLAALDSRRLPTGPVLLAEEDGILRAALAPRTGTVIADPFAHTAHLVALIHRHATRQTTAPGRAGRDADRLHSRLPRLALRAG